MKEQANGLIKRREKPLPVSGFFEPAAPASPKRQYVRQSYVNGKNSGEQSKKSHTASHVKSPDHNQPSSVRPEYKLQN